MKKTFPRNFTWGAATAAYQIEGAVAEDGRLPSVWDMHCRKPGAVFQGHTGAIACDHYHRWREDVRLMKRIGLQAYRLSVAWPRVIPAGTGKVNPKGLAFYDRLIDALLEADIEPWVTLFHWDMPLALYHRGGWLNRDSADWFADYTTAVVDTLSDRVRHWIPLNEPQCFIHYGLQTGMHAPGDRLALHEVLAAGHNAMRGHGQAVQVIRARAKKPARVGCAPAGPVFIPAREGNSSDARTAMRAMASVQNRSPWNFTWWSDPLIFGRYPADGWKAFGSDVPQVKTGDLKTIAQPLDFFGVNIYGGAPVKTGPRGAQVEVRWPAGHPHTMFQWPVAPTSLYWGPKFLFERYGLPIVITENGLSNQDWVAVDGKAHDPQRIDFLTRYIGELHRAIRDGVRVEGYFHWSLLDNFEWAEGYKERFGLIHVDYATGRRTLKDSAAWYRSVIRRNGLA